MTTQQAEKTKEDSKTASQGHIIVLGYSVPTKFYSFEERFYTICTLYQLNPIPMVDVFTALLFLFFYLKIFVSTQELSIYKDKVIRPDWRRKNPSFTHLIPYLILKSIYVATAIIIWVKLTFFTNYKCLKRRNLKLIQISGILLEAYPYLVYPWAIDHMRAFENSNSIQRFILAAILIKDTFLAIFSLMLSKHSFFHGQLFNPISKLRYITLYLLASCWYLYINIRGLNPTENLFYIIFRLSIVILFLLLLFCYRSFWNPKGELLFKTFISILLATNLTTKICQLAGIYPYLVTSIAGLFLYRIGVQLYFEREFNFFNLDVSSESTVIALLDFYTLRQKKHKTGLEQLRLMKYLGYISQHSKKCSRENCFCKKDDQKLNLIVFIVEILKFRQEQLKSQDLLVTIVKFQILDYHRYIKDLKSNLLLIRKKNLMGKLQAGNLQTILKLLIKNFNAGSELKSSSYGYILSRTKGYLISTEKTLGLPLYKVLKFKNCYIEFINLIKEIIAEKESLVDYLRTNSKARISKLYDKNWKIYSLGKIVDQKAKNLNKEEITPTYFLASMVAYYQFVQCDPITAKIYERKYKTELSRIQKELLVTEIKNIKEKNILIKSVILRCCLGVDNLGTILDASPDYKYYLGDRDLVGVDINELFPSNLGQSHSNAMKSTNSIPKIFNRQREFAVVDSTNQLCRVKFLLKYCPSMRENYSALVCLKFCNFLAGAQLLLNHKHEIIAADKKFHSIAVSNAPGYEFKNCREISPLLDEDMKSFIVRRTGKGKKVEEYQRLGSLLITNEERLEKYGKEYQIEKESFFYEKMKNFSFKAKFKILKFLDQVVYITVELEFDDQFVFGAGLGGSSNSFSLKSENDEFQKYEDFYIKNKYEQKISFGDEKKSRPLSNPKKSYFKFEDTSQSLKSLEHADIDQNNDNKEIFSNDTKENKLNEDAIKKLSLKIKQEAEQDYFESLWRLTKERNTISKEIHLPHQFDNSFLNKNKKFKRKEIKVSKKEPYINSEIYKNNQQKKNENILGINSSLRSKNKKIDQLFSFSQKNSNKQKHKKNEKIFQKSPKNSKESPPDTKLPSSTPIVTPKFYQNPLLNKIKSPEKKFKGKGISRSHIMSENENRIIFVEDELKKNSALSQVSPPNRNRKIADICSNSEQRPGLFHIPKFSSNSNSPPDRFSSGISSTSSDFYQKAFKLTNLIKTKQKLDLAARRAKSRFEAAARRRWVSSRHNSPRIALATAGNLTGISSFLENRLMREKILGDSSIGTTGFANRVESYKLLKIVLSQNKRSRAGCFILFCIICLVSLFSIFLIGYTRFFSNFVKTEMEIFRQSKQICGVDKSARKLITTMLETSLYDYTKNNVDFDLILGITPGMNSSDFSAGNLTLELSKKYSSTLQSRLEIYLTQGEKMISKDQIDLLYSIRKPDWKQIGKEKVKYKSSLHNLLAKVPDKLQKFEFFFKKRKNGRNFEKMFNIVDYLLDSIPNSLLPGLEELIQTFKYEILEQRPRAIKKVFYLSCTTLIILLLLISFIIFGAVRKLSRDLKADIEVYKLPKDSELDFTKSIIKKQKKLFQKMNFHEEKLLRSAQFPHTIFMQQKTFKNCEIKKNQVWRKRIIKNDKKISSVKFLYKILIGLFIFSSLLFTKLLYTNSFQNKFTKLETFTLNFCTKTFDKENYYLSALLFNIFGNSKKVSGYLPRQNKFENSFIGYIEHINLFENKGKEIFGNRYFEYEALLVGDQCSGAEKYGELTLQACKNMNGGIYRRGMLESFYFENSYIKSMYRFYLKGEDKKSDQFELNLESIKQFYGTNGFLELRFGHLLMNQVFEQRLQDLVEKRKKDIWGAFQTFSEVFTWTYGICFILFLSYLFPVFKKKLRKDEIVALQSYRNIHPEVLFDNAYILNKAKKRFGSSLLGRI